MIEWIKHGETWRPVGGSKTLKLKAGMLLELNDGRRLLVGDINELGGVCDDCAGLYDHDVIARYAYIPDEFRGSP